MIVKQVKRFYVAVSNSKMYIGLYDPHTGVGEPVGVQKLVVAIFISILL